MISNFGTKVDDLLKETTMSVTELQTGNQNAQSRPGAGQITVTKLRSMKQKGEKIVMLTAYDYSTAKLADAAGIPVLLVGDSLGRVMLGYGVEGRRGSHRA